MEHRNRRTTRYLLLKIKVLCVFRFNNCTLTVDHAFQKINRCYFYSNLPRARVRKKTSTTDDQHHTMARSPPHRGGNPKSLASCIMNFFFARADHRPRRIGICGYPQRREWGTVSGSTSAGDEHQLAGSALASREPMFGTTIFWLDWPTCDAPHSESIIVVPSSSR